MPHRFAIMARCSWFCWLVAVAVAASGAWSSSSPASLLISEVWPRPESPQLVVPTAEHDAPSAKPEVEVTFPAPHSWWQVDEATGRLAKLAVHFTLRDFRIPEDGFLRVGGEKIQTGNQGELGDFTVKDNVSSYVMSNLEPGSFFFTLQLVQQATLPAEGRIQSDDQEVERVVAETTLHLEVVVPVSSSAMLTYTPADPYAPPPLRQVTLDTRLRRSSAAPMAPPPQPIPICYILTTKGSFDGQKKMWLQLVEALSSPQRSADVLQGNSTRVNNPQRTPSFRVEAITFDTINLDSPVLLALEKLGIQLKGGAQQVEVEELFKSNVSVEQLETTIVERFYAEFPEANPLQRGSVTHRRLSIQDQKRLANLKPAFVQNVWRTLVDQLHASCLDGVVVMSNSRFATDELVVNSARLAGARAVVMELANLFPNVMEVDALFAPSHFALRHPSVVSSLLTDRSFVVSTGVNTNVFAPAKADSAPHQQQVDGHESLFVVGYVGRLNTDKSVGALIAMARILHRACSFCKLRLIGEGILKPQLKALAAEWGLLETTVEFVDGIFNDEAALAAELRKMHVYATPALETLGISVLEAMSTGLPVVGFIIGGTTEFLVDGYNCVGVRERSPEAFSGAIMTLVRDPGLRETMGCNARKTIEQRFSRDESIREIAMLYQSLARHR